jgi:hypothetical protein
LVQIFKIHLGIQFGNFFVEKKIVLLYVRRVLLVPFKENQALCKIICPPHFLVGSASVDVGAGVGRGGTAAFALLGSHQGQA